MDWIKKEKKLPEKPKISGFYRCLVCSECDFVREAMFNSRTRRFQNLEFEDIHDRVTHWMSLPKPPTN